MEASDCGAPPGWRSRAQRHRHRRRLRLLRHGAALAGPPPGLDLEPIFVFVTTAATVATDYRLKFVEYPILALYPRPSFASLEPLMIEDLKENIHDEDLKEDTHDGDDGGYGLHADTNSAEGEVDYEYPSGPWPAVNDNCPIAELKVQVPAGVRILMNPGGDNLDGGDGGYGLYADTNFRKGEVVYKYTSIPWPRDRGNPEQLADNVDMHLFGASLPPEGFTVRITPSRHGGMCADGSVECSGFDIMCNHSCGANMYYDVQCSTAVAARNILVGEELTVNHSCHDLVGEEGEEGDLDSGGRELRAVLESRFRLPAPIARALAILLERTEPVQSDIEPFLEELYEMTSHHDFWDQQESQYALQGVVQEFFVETDVWSATHCAAP